MLSEFIVEHKLPAAFANLARKWFIPAAQQIAQLVVKDSSPIFIGINGCQGSGKSTLASLFNHYLTEEKHLTVVNLSLDDFYLSQQQRAKLAEQLHPLLATRGVPGTHDTQLLKQTLDCLKHKQSVALPRFDKAQDNPLPPHMWPTAPDNIDVVIIEGWCWGVGYQQPIELDQPINQLEEQKDAGGEWRIYVNHQLANHYMPLYQYMDKWLMLKAPNFDCVKEWRWQQEQKLIAKVGNTNNNVMNQAQINEFVSYFQRLTEHALATLPQHCDLVFSLDDNRQIYSQQGVL